MHSVNDFVNFVKSHNSVGNSLVNLPIYNDNICAYNDNYKVTTEQQKFMEVQTMTNYKFSFHCVDNGGKHQAFTVSAPSKAAAIDKALKKARKNAAGDICGTWEIRLQPSF